MSEKKEIWIGTQFIEEKISGTVSWKKRKIYYIINDANIGDVIIVSELSRLGRSMLEIMEILSIVSTKKLSLYSVKGCLLYTSDAADE